MKQIALHELNLNYQQKSNLLIVNSSIDWDKILGQPDVEFEHDVLLADPELKKPSLYRVIMYNDDYTPMDFVVDILQDYFNHSLEKATNIMLDIHYNGKGIAGIYPKDIAETKAQQVNTLARLSGYPLLTDIEPQADK